MSRQVEVVQESVLACVQWTAYASTTQTPYTIARISTISLANSQKQLRTGWYVYTALSYGSN